MRIQLLFLGKTRREPFRAVIEDYTARISKFAPIDLREVREESPAAWRKVAIAPGATVVLLDAAGKEMDSTKFAAWLGNCRDRGAREIVFLCGGAEGFPGEIARLATARISLSPMTFSHELARVMLAEQLYRAFTMLAGHPYAK